MKKRFLSALLAVAVFASLMMGISLPQYCCAWIYNWIFRRVDGEIDTKGRKVERS